VVGGDRLQVQVAVEGGAAALITTPGAAKFYRSGGPVAAQTHTLRVDQGAFLEWLPQETIIYAHAHAETVTRVDVAADAGFMGWDILCLGLPTCGEPFAGGRFAARLEIDRQGRPIYRDRLFVDGADGLGRPTGLRGHGVSATFVATGVNAPLRDSLRTAVTDKSALLWGLTLMDDLLVVRALGNDSAEIKDLFRCIWTWLRPRLSGRPACVPRIWET
jgi:urease accessory protein